MFLANIGNWKKLRRQEMKDIYKCNECEVKLEIEKKGQEIKARVLLHNAEPHNWCDKKHLEGFKANEDSINRIHTSIEAFIR